MRIIGGVENICNSSFASSEVKEFKEFKGVIAPYGR